ncbi:MAG: carboxylate-amine ligase [Proteobacteria bacterium]|nr:carboxylate-amine ligase [Pseudomonadota bacterium]MCP4920526.1 carboxylate-amine ligase [Pseudomonadota bacterium]
MQHPIPGSPDELVAFEKLKARLPDLFRTVSSDDRFEHTVVVVPSLSMHPAELAKITGVHHYEERLLYMLMLLRRPRTHLVFVTSQPLNPSVVDYYLHLLSGVPTNHARRRLTLLTCLDASARPLSEKILERPMLQRKIREAIPDLSSAHLSVFNSTPLERTLAVQLGIPLYATDPALMDLGSKSGCREIFREAGVKFPDGFERLRTATEITDALDTLKGRYPDMRRAVVKLNEGFSGEGNALFYFDECPTVGDRKAWIRENLPNLKFEAPMEHWESFEQKYGEMGGIVECFVEGKPKESPSCQARVNALGQAMTISTHDQVLGGPSGQVFLGCTFPAREEYRVEVQEAGYQVAQVLAARGVVGRFATDFVSVKDENDRWEHHAIEVNLRKGGTTHPFLTLKFLTDGKYDRDTGMFHTPQGHAKYYYASDTLHSELYRGLSPDDLIETAVYHGLHFHGASERGVVFHLMGALSEFGKLGTVCIGDNPQQARFLYNKTVGVLDSVSKELHGGR